MSFKGSYDILKPSHHGVTQESCLPGAPCRQPYPIPSHCHCVSNIRKGFGSLVRFRSLLDFVCFLSSLRPMSPLPSRLWFGGDDLMTPWLTHSHSFRETQNEDPGAEVGGSGLVPLMSSSGALGSLL